MQQPLNRQLGAQGETAVKLFLEKLGWGAVPTGDHDLGTDLYAAVRDVDLREMGLSLGVQVKTGDSYWEPAGKKAGFEGWYFTEPDQKHANYWSNHPLPHIVVLMRDDLETAYWAFANRNTIESTGKGFKIPVPATQPLDARFRQEWVRAAEFAQKRTALEGARWSFDIESMPVASHAAYALLAPRLVAPHPNILDSEVISWPEAIALCVQESAGRWETSAQHNQEVPAPIDAATHADWGWRFAAAIHAWIVLRDSTPLTSLKTPAKPASYRVAHAVATAVALMDEGRHDDAEKWLVRLAVEKEHSLEQGWLNVHLSHIAAERGDLSDAHRRAEVATVHLAPVAGDVSVSAVRAAAAWALFATSSTLSSDVSPVVTAMDNPSSWWRTEATASGLISALRRAFAEWSHDPSFTFYASDVARDSLVSATRIARLAGAHDQARSSEEIRALSDFALRPLAERRPLHTLRNLRDAGAHKYLRLAIAEVARQGPLADLRSLVDGIDLDRSARTTSRADLTIIERAGRFATDERAREQTASLLRILADPEPFRARVAARYSLEPALYGALAGLRHMLDATQVTQLVGLLTAQPAPDEAAGVHIARLLAVVPLTDLDQKRLHYAVDDAPQWLQAGFRRAAGVQHPTRRQEVHDRLLVGDLSALEVLPDLNLLAANEIAVVVPLMAQSVRSRRHGLEALGLVFSEFDTARDLAAICVLYPHIVDVGWEAVTEFLADPRIPGFRKRSVALLLSRHPEAIPTSHKAGLLHAAEEARLTAHEVQAGLGRHIAEVGASLDVLTTALGGEGSEGLMALLTSGVDARRDVVDYLAYTGSQPSVLAALLGDRDEKVASSAARGLAVAARSLRVPSAMLSVIERIAAQDSLVGAQLVLGLTGDGPLPRELAGVVDVLTQHRAVDVRKGADRLIVG